MNTGRQALGASGEAVVAAWYEGRGYVVRERNWRSGHGELDLIVSRGGQLVFVEVRSRVGVVDPVVLYQSVGHGKRRVLGRTARAYLRGVGGRRYCSWRFDVAGVIYDGARAAVHCWENVGWVGR